MHNFGKRSLLLAVAALYRTSLVAGQGFTAESIDFSPAVAGEATEITISFTPTYDISAGSYLYITLAGFTTGDRDGIVGDDIGDWYPAAHSVVLLSTSSTFSAYYLEGTTANGFDDSILYLYAVTAISNSVAQTVILDRSNGFKSNCGHPASYTGFTMTCTDSLYAIMSDYLIPSTAIPTSGCYLLWTYLEVDLGQPKHSLELNLTFYNPRHLIASDYISVSMYGFTTGSADGTDGSSIAAGSLLTDSTSTYSGSWSEGTYVSPGDPGYHGSTLTLTALSTVAVGTHTVMIYRENAIKAQCGMQEDNPYITISAVSPGGEFAWTVANQAFDHTDAIGPGCASLNNCTGHGACDYCQQSCTCSSGFGSASDNAGYDVEPDCSARVCPLGRAWTPVLNYGDDPLTAWADGDHEYAECSNVGTCDRLYGKCVCPKGYTGGACEKTACPNKCSGHGACRSLRQMGLMHRALPLSNNTEYYGHSSTAWDADMLYACVCDSTWQVGLQAGQTQTPEYFGADCSLRHCPSGDDPDTTEDETDCYLVTATGGRGVGAQDNLCHVDCSNRGLCDYSTGLCSCFRGYYGAACDQQATDGYYGND